MERAVITIGEILRPHGNKGEVRVRPLTDFPERFGKLRKVFVQLPKAVIEAEVECARYHGDVVILKLRGYSSISEAETIRGGLVGVSAEDAVKLPPGHYYLFEILGLDVFTTTGDYLGEIKEVIRTGSNDVYVVRMPGNGKPGRELLVPAIKDVVREIDVEGKKMVVELLEGLL